MNQNRKPKTGKPASASTWATGPLFPPPYGCIADNFERALKRQPVPDGFQIGGAPATTAQFEVWVSACVNEFSEWLWPELVTAPALKWSGKAASFALDLTAVDLELMLELKQNLAKAPDGRAGSQRTHMSMFVAEDREDQWSTYAEYESALDSDLMKRMTEAMEKGAGNIVGLAVALKNRLQRPRAYQMALHLGAKDFSYLEAYSAGTPSMISGHSIQGLVAATSAYVKQLSALQKFENTDRYLQQWGVDHGDRRVFAGVHYPSDNISSWYILLKACDNNLFGAFGAEAKVFLWEAITKGAVFKAMNAHRRAHANSVYKTPLGKIAALAGRPLPQA